MNFVTQSRPSRSAVSRSSSRWHAWIQTMSGSLPCSAHFVAVEVELLLERLVREERRHGDAPAVLRRELVGPVGRAAEEDAERRASGNGTTCESATSKYSPVWEKRSLPSAVEEQVDRLLVPWPRVLVEGDARLLRDPAVAAPDAPLVAPAGEDVRHRDRRRQHHRVVVRQRVEHRAEVDLLRPLRGRGEERRRVRRDRRTSGRRSARSTRSSRIRAGRRSRSAPAPRAYSCSGVLPSCSCISVYRLNRIDRPPVRDMSRASIPPG